MADKNKDFFKQKKAWSKVKDELLSCYLTPYMQKIMRTNKPIMYVDCFAGKGKFDDDEKGSPLIALEIIDNCLERSKTKESYVNASFIELNHAEELKNNIRDYKNANIYPGKFEDNIPKLLLNKKNYNVFLYIDPYGIRALNYKMFCDFKNSYNFNSIELLINMNSFGFFREGCRIMNAKYEPNDFFDDLLEYNPTKLTSNEESIVIMNEIAGGEYWQDIIRQYKNNEINAFKAEDLFARQYCAKLKECYKYVLNMPLRIKKGQHPKYRMIHATNHVDGCLLMANNICQRWEMMQDIQTNHQISLFEENCDNQDFDLEDIEKKLLIELKKCYEYSSLNNFSANFYMEYGPICKTGDLNKILKKLENDKIEVKRTPAYTKTNKKSTFFSETGDQKIEIRWKNE